VLPAETAFIRADDLGISRGDGIFETMHVRGGQPWLLAEHLKRLYVSAGRMDLEPPDSEQLTELAHQACAAWPAEEEGALKMVVTRGPEGEGKVTCFATVSPITDVAKQARDKGVEVVALSFGYPAKARDAAPWLLGGVKSLSYAANMASLRHASKQGFGDVLWISSDGYALEAPTASLVWKDGDLLCTVPPEGTGILAGVTAQFALDHAGELGLEATFRMITVDELVTKEAAWLLSSGRGIAPIRSVDGITLTSSDIGLRTLLGF
jgi:4-amino-4-deoxychorismate lyase